MSCRLAATSRLAAALHTPPPQAARLKYPAEPFQILPVACIICAQAARLKYLAESFQIPVLVTNQVTTRIGGDGGGGGGGQQGQLQARRGVLPPAARCSAMRRAAVALHPRYAFDAAGVAR